MYFTDKYGTGTHYEFHKKPENDLPNLWSHEQLPKETEASRTGSMSGFYKQFVFIIEEEKVLEEALTFFLSTQTITPPPPGF